MKSGYIVVEGPIGVGKTSLARRLADALDARALLEMPEENPFLERFYRSREQFALPTQLFFLFQRARQIQELKQGELFSSGAVSDFLIEKDRLFALANLDTDELRLYEQVYGQTIRELPAPDRVVYLQAPVDVLLDRIRRRGVPYEDLIDRPYLQALVDAYTQFFHHYTAAPLLVVNAAQINFVDRDEDFGMLLDYIMRIRSGRHFFNPMAAS
ncbi:MAG TPA: deoxynucleoside kinase [Burkholderiales bacterium]|jgi:deoxyadenosine/deoxycytidine kinase